MTEEIRRVVTGEVDGRGSVFLAQDDVEPIHLGKTRWYGVWGWDTRPRLPFGDETRFEPRSAFPDPEGDGMRLNVISFPPGSGVMSESSTGHLETATSDEWKRLAEAQPYGRRSGEKPGMHATDTIDVGFVISGEITLELAGGEEVLLKPGHFCLQVGAMHAWRNTSDEECTMGFVVLSAKREDLTATGG